MDIRHITTACIIVIISSFMQLDIAARGAIRGRCTNEKSCKSLKNKCQCYCSGIGGFRNKSENDKPVYVADDPNKVYCYCKQWDLDAYPKGERPADQPQ